MGAAHPLKFLGGRRPPAPLFKKYENFEKFWLTLLIIHGELRDTFFT